MVARVLCGGPSMRSASPVDADETFAVNVTAWRYPCDWACYGDGYQFAQVLARGIPNPRKGFLTTRHWTEHYKKHFPGMKFVELPLWRNDYSINPVEHSRHCTTTFPSALFFAAQRHPVIHVYGADLTGAPDLVGHARGHTPLRFCTEYMWIREVTRYFEHSTFHFHCLDAQLLAWLRAPVKPQQVLEYLTTRESAGAKVS